MTDRSEANTLTAIISQQLTKLADTINNIIMSPLVELYSKYIQHVLDYITLYYNMTNILYIQNIQYDNCYITDDHITIS